MITEALIYLSMGWCVYPAHYVDENDLCSCGRSDCPTPGKHPVGRWTEFQERLPTRDEVNVWFGSMRCNIGTVTGQVSGLVVVDVDGAEGVKSVRDLKLERTLMSRTGSGGRHLFYASHNPVPSKVRIMDGVDIRAEGAYVILPPSGHLSGRHYEWLEPRGLTIFDPKPFEKHYSSSSPFTNGSNWYNDLLVGVHEGSRSVSAARLAGRYSGLGLSPSETWVLMYDWNLRNIPPLNENELLRTVKAIRRKYERETLPTQINTFRDIENLLNGGAHGK